MKQLQPYKFSALLPLNGTVLYGGFRPNPKSQPRGFVLNGIDKPRGKVRSANDEKPRMALTVDNNH